MLLFQNLTNDFRVTYSKFWLSILNADLKEVQKYGEQLGVGELFGLFACMVTARSWDSISRGIDKKERSSDEVSSNTVIVTSWCICMLDVFPFILFEIEVACMSLLWNFSYGRWLKEGIDCFGSWSVQEIIR